MKVPFRIILENVFLLSLLSRYFNNEVRMNPLIGRILTEWHLVLTNT